MVFKLGGEKIYEEAGSSPWVAIVGWLIMLIILYFAFASNDFANPAILFSPVLLWLIVIMPHDNWKSVKRFFGLYVPSNKEWLIPLMLIFGGISAWLMLFLLNNVGMSNGLFVANMSSTPDIYSGIIYAIMANLVIAVGENFFVIGSSHYLSNWLYGKYNIDARSAALLGLLIAIILWCSSHIFHYTISMGSDISVYFGLIFTGTIMFGLGYIFEPLIEPSPRFALELYPIYFSLAFHLVYNVLIALNMAAIPITILGIPIVS